VPEAVTERGLENAFERHKRLAHATREAVKAIGLKLFSKESHSNSVTAIQSPDGLDARRYTRISGSSTESPLQEARTGKGKDIQDRAFGVCGYV